MKHPITLRIDPDLLAQAKRMAASENRTLTNFIETLMKQRLDGTAAPAQQARHVAPEHSEQTAIVSEHGRPTKGTH
jgi:hypothetical protein